MSSEYPPYPQTSPPYMKIYLSQDEIFTTDMVLPGDYHYSAKCGKEIDLPEETVARLRNVRDAYLSLQEELETYYESP